MTISSPLENYVFTTATKWFMGILGVYSLSVWIAYMLAPICGAWRHALRDYGCANYLEY